MVKEKRIMMWKWIVTWILQFIVWLYIVGRTNTLGKNQQQIANKLIDLGMDKDD